MIITVFEDVEYLSLFPLNINRASCELRCGSFTNLERINNLLTDQDTIQLVVRNDIAKLITEIKEQIEKEEGWEGEDDRTNENEEWEEYQNSNEEEKQTQEIISTDVNDPKKRYIKIEDI